MEVLDAADIRKGSTDLSDLILDLHDVSHRYGATLALDRLSLQVQRGEFLTLLGPSGSGKSTLLRVIAGLEMPESVERMVLDGADIRGVPANRRNVATVFQLFALFPHMTVGENVEYGLKVRRVPPRERAERAARALALVRLPDKSARRVHQLSGGERQRVALARALVTEPDILLLDEPLGALDERLRLVELIDLHRRTGATFILVTHSQEEAITMSDRIVLLHAARVEQVATPRTLFEEPATPFAARFMGIENILDGELASIEGAFATVRVGRHAVAGRLLPSARHLPAGATVFAAVRAENIKVGHLPPLDDAPAGVAGRPGATIYKGKYRDVPVETAIGPLVCRLWDTSAALPSAVRLSWEPQNCIIGPST